MPTIDQIMEPKAIRASGAIKDHQITHDVILNGCTEEWKFLANIYKDFYFETFQCADPLGCPDCIEMGRTEIMLGWAHRQGYCTADKIRLFHCPDHEIAQMIWADRVAIVEWLWDDYFANNVVYHKAMANWDGRHRTLGVAVSLDKIPESLYEIWKR